MFTRTVTTEEWLAIEQRARDRAVPDCPVCQEPFQHSKQAVLLTCSHVFHDGCLSAYEKFTVMNANANAGNAANNNHSHSGHGGSGGGDGRAVSPSGRRRQNAGCPICRSAYQKMLWDFVPSQRALP